ncbi:MAG: hypothetical protein HOE32_02225 [Nitrospina sp.]|nr:hypothetical protein [Nitrospina sp.]
MPNKIAEEGDFYDPEDDPVLEFQDKVLSCLSDIHVYNSHIMKNSESLEKRIKDFRELIHGEDV